MIIGKLLKAVFKCYHIRLYALPLFDLHTVCMLHPGLIIHCFYGDCCATFREFSKIFYKTCYNDIIALISNFWHGFYGIVIYSGNELLLSVLTGESLHEMKSIIRRSKICGGKDI